MPLFHTIDPHHSPNSTLLATTMIPPPPLHTPLRLLCILGILTLLTFSIACSAETPTQLPMTQPPATTTPTLTAPPTAPPAPTPSPTPSPTATASSTPPSPTATATPTPTGTPQNPLADASKHVYALLQTLLEELGHRESASPEELQAAEKLQARFQSMGYSTGLQPFAFRNFDFARWRETGGENSRAVVNDMDFTGLMLGLPPDTVTVTGPLTSVGLGRSEDIPPEGLEGKVAWFQPEDGILADKQSLQALQENVEKAAKAGAVAAVISGDLGFDSYSLLLIVESSIPALLFRPDVEEFWTQAASSGQADMSVTVEVRNLESQNIVAEMKGAGNGLVIVGAHYDIVPTTSAGANDNTSSVAIILSLAEALAERSLTYTVRFVAFGSEELGLYGSRHYVESLSEAELSSIKAMLNFDVVGSGPYLEAIGPETLQNLALSIADDLEVEAQPGTLPPGAASDHVPFEDKGIPTLLLFGPDISRIHTPEDVLEFINPELLGSAYLIALTILESDKLSR